MAEFSKIINLIKVSDIRTSTLTKEIKEMEKELKSIETERVELVGREKELILGISYKRKAVDSKECDKRLLERQYETWKRTLSEITAKYGKEHENLEQIQKELWDVRKNFSKEVNQFLTEYEFLVFNKHKIIEAAKKRGAEKNLKIEVASLGHEVSALEIEYHKIKSHFDLTERLKIDVKLLETKPDTGAEFRRLKNRIETCLKELNQYDSLLGTQQIILGFPNIEPNNTTENFSLNTDETLKSQLTGLPNSNLAIQNEVISSTSAQEQFLEWKQPVNFVPKVPSAIIRKKIYKDSESQN